VTRCRERERETSMSRWTAEPDSVVPRTALVRRPITTDLHDSVWHAPPRRIARLVPGDSSGGHTTTAANRFRGERKRRTRAVRGTTDIRPPPSRRRHGRFTLTFTTNGVHKRLRSTFARMSDPNSTVGVAGRRVEPVPSFPPRPKPLEVTVLLDERAYVGFPQLMDFQPWR